MNRRIILPVGVFVAILVVVLVYWKIAGSSDDSGVRTSLEHVEPPKASDTAPEGDVGASGGLGLNYVHRDERGNLVARCQAKSWDKQSKTVFLLDEPVVTFYTKDGRAISLSGKKAVVHGEEISKSVKVTQGTISGDVLLTVDMSEEITAVPLEERPEDKLEIYLESAEFDNDLLQIESAGSVTVLSKDVDMYGRGLSLTWNQSPSELRLLRITEGEKVIVRSMPNQLSEAEQQSEKAEEATVTTDEKIETGDSVTPPAGGNVASAKSGELKKSDELPDWTAPGPDEYADDMQQNSASTQPAATQPTTAAANKPATKPATQPATQGDTETVKPKRRNVLRADFIDTVHGVHVDQGPNHLRGADKLSIIFRLSEQQTSQKRAKPRTTAAPTTGPGKIPTSQPAAAPATQPEKSPDAPMIITWQGPLEIRSIGHEENPDSKQVAIIADGEELKFTAEDTLTTCRRMIFRSPEQVGRLMGTADKPVQMTSANGQKIIAEDVRLDRKQKLVYLDGSGYIEDVSRPTTAPETGDKESKTAVTVKWSKGAIARIREYETAQPDGSSTTRMSFEEAKICGKVELTQPETGEAVHCENMHLFMAEMDGREYPTRVIATGDVVATQTDSDTMADKVTVYFAKPMPDERDKKDKGWISTGIDRMIAEGNVRFYSKQEDQAASLENGQRRPNMTGEKVTVYFIASSPDDAKDKTGRRSPKVDRMTADGRGSLFFRTTKQASGEKLEKPRDVAISWSKEMDYKVADLEAAFEGDVKLDSAGEHLEGQEMTVKFEKGEIAAASSDASKTATADDGKKKSRGFDASQFASMQLINVTTSRDVKVESTLKDEQDNLLRRVNLKTETGTLAYDVKAGQMTVTGAGTFAAEDYRAPRLKTDKANETDVQRPNQTYLKWARIMRYTRTKGEDGTFDGGGEVIAKEDVEMVFASGKYLVKQDRLKHVDWGDLTEGRVTTLGCDDLWVKFDAAEEIPADTNKKLVPGSEDITLGKLKEFKAMGKVLATDGVEIKRKITADTLHYTSDDQLLRILGTKEKPAALIETNSLTGTVRPMKSSRILWYRANDNFVVEDTKAGG